MNNIYLYKINHLNKKNRNNSFLPQVDYLFNEKKLNLKCKYNSKRLKFYK